MNKFYRKRSRYFRILCLYFGNQIFIHLHIFGWHTSCACPNYKFMFTRNQFKIQLFLNISGCLVCIIFILSVTLLKTDLYFRHYPFLVQRFITVGFQKCSNPIYKFNCSLSFQLNHNYLKLSFPPRKSGVLIDELILIL